MAQPEVTQHNSPALSTASAPAKLRLFAQIQKATDNDLGIGYIKDSPNGPRVVVSDLEHGAFATLPTRNSLKKFEQVVEEFIAIPEFRFMLFHSARAYSAREAIMFEGGTAIGKTYAVTSLGNLIYGPNTVLPEIYCHGQTDVSELIGKPVPAALSNSQLMALDEFLRSPEGQSMRAEMLHEEGRVDTAELTLRIALRLGFPAQKGSFRLMRGKLPLAMSGDIAPDGSFIELPNGPGVPFHIQELGTAPTLVTNALLRTRGTKGMIAERIQLNELDGAVVTAGPSFGLVMSTNPAGQEFRDRFVVDPANSRALVWIRLPDTLQVESLKKAAKHIFSFHKVARDADAAQAILDLQRYPELSALLGTVTALFHEQYSQTLARGEGSRKQKIPITMDNIWKVARYLQHYQRRSPSGECVDLVQTLKDAVVCHYINSLESKPSIVPNTAASNTAGSPQSNTTGKTLLDHLEQTLQNSSTKPISFRGELVGYAQAIETLTKEAWDQELALERVGSDQSAYEIARAKMEIAKVHLLLGKMRAQLDDEQFSSYVAELKARASAEALSAIDSWTESRG